MSIPFQIVWSDVSNNILTAEAFPINFPGQSTTPAQLQVRSNAVTLQTYETLVGVKFFLTGDPDDINIVQNIWTTIGGSTRPELNGGVDISFDFGQTYIRFDITHGLESAPSTWIPLPAEAVGAQGADQTLGAFDTAHIIIRYVIPPGATQYEKFDIRLGIDFDIL
jgi:hypothetical protein